jgi:hypothetical protein
MTRQLPTDVSLRSQEATPRNGAAIAAAASALLAEMERSLEGSQRALLSRDLEGLERATREQIALRRSLQVLWPETLVSRSLMSHTQVSQTAGPDVRAQDRPALQLDPSLAAGLRAAEWRVLYLGRVQAALLTRTQRSLRIVSHRLAGSTASYAAPSYARPAFEPCGALPRKDAGADGDRSGKEENGKIKIKNEKEEEKEAGPCRV